MRIFDTHAHYDDAAFEEDRDQLLSSLPEQGVELVVNVGADLTSSKTTIALTERYSFIYGAIGFHPENAGSMEEMDMEWLRESSVHKKVVAIGEIGLDYYWKDSEKEIQKKWFDRQLELARQVKLPVIIHSREASRDTLEMLLAAGGKTQLNGVIHCYSYSKETAREYLNMGFMIGIGGVLTFKNANNIKEAAAYIPLESILLETDCPYLAPMPYRGKRNSSLNIPYVAQELASIKGIDYEEVLEKTFQNGKKLYEIGRK